MATNRKDLPDHFYTLEEYFALEHASDRRYEYWDGDIVCMSGGSQWHSLISSNAHFHLQLHLRDGRCRAFTADLPVKTPTAPPYRYPDVTVGCQPLMFENIRGVDALINPVLIVEVMSQNSAGRDQDDKFTAYKAISSFSHHLLISQETPKVTHYARQADDRWMREDVKSLDGAVKLTSIGCTLSLRDIYDGVTFEGA